MNSEKIIIDPKIIRSLTKSIVRKSTLLHLNEIYPSASYPAEIARNINANSLDVIGALKGTNSRYNYQNSLLNIGAIITIEDGTHTFYKISETGLKIVQYINNK